MAILLNSCTVNLSKSFYQSFCVYGLDDALNNMFNETYCQIVKVVNTIKYLLPFYL